MTSKGYVDADGHVRDPDLRKYLPEPHNKRQVIAMGGGDGFDRQMFGTLGESKADAERWLEVLELGGLETTVLYPTGGLSVGFIHEPNFAAAFCQAYNDSIAKEFLSVSSRLKAVAILPFQDVDAAVQELRRAVRDLGMVGAMLPADGPFLLGRPEFDPIYAEAERLGTMVAPHATGSLRGRGLDEYLFDSLIQAHTLSHSGAQMRQMTSMIFEGVMEKFPELRIAFLEAGCSWVPYWMDRMDEEFEFRGKLEARLLLKEPSQYIRSDNVFVACEPEEQLLPEAARALGENSILYASDFPHWDGSYPESLNELEAREDLSAEVKRQILIDNPKRLYRL